jgi:hypothetical protein
MYVSKNLKLILNLFQTMIAVGLEEIKQFMVGTC